MLGLLSYLIGPMFDDVLVDKNNTGLYYLGLLIFFVFSFRGISGLLQRIIMVSVGVRVKMQLQRDLMNHVLALDSLFFETNPPGNLMARILGDSEQIKTLWAGLISPTARDLISIISLLVVSISIDWVWTLMACTGIPLLVGPIIFVQKRVRKTTRVERSAAAAITIRLDEIFHGIRTIKLNIQEARQIARFLTEALRARRASVRIAASEAGVPALVDIVAGLGFMFMLMLGGTDVINGEKTIGQFMSFFTATVLLFDPLKRLSAIFARWQVTKVSMERIYSMFEFHPTITSPAKPVEPTQAIETGDIEINNVSFKYGQLPVFKNLSFIAKSSETTALVGPSGAGKTTIFNLITRMVDPISGQILIGGMDIQNLDLAELRNLFAVVAQDSGIFDESIKDNILLGNIGATEDEVIAAADAAHVTAFSQNLPKGLDSPCGPRGSNLSGGQRQRVAIARALLRNAPILLLDEPTSSLDAKSEELVQSAINNLAVNRTIIVIAHRLSTVREANNIIVLDEGNVVEMGTHETLMEQVGLYSALYRSQLKFSV